MLLKARECSACRRELVERDKEDNILYRWNGRLRKWFYRSVEPAKIYTTVRRNYVPEGQKIVQVWACVCGNLTEEREETISKERNQ